MPFDAGEGIIKGSRVVIDGLKARPEMNGCLGTVEGFNESSGRANVLPELDGAPMRECMALKLEALTLAEGFEPYPVGTRVRLAGIEKKEELNGKLGTVEGFIGERVTVYIESIREKMSLKLDALAVADAAPSGDKSERVTTDRKLTVECNGVALKLTLSAKQMQKKFSKAVLAPFLKAYCKKQGIDELPLSEVAQVTVDSESHTKLQVLTEIHIFSAEQCLKGAEGDIDIEVHLFDGHVKAPERKKEKAVEALPMNTRVIVSGLTSFSGRELNGRQGRLTSYDESKERYGVTLQAERGEPSKVVSVHLTNLIDIGQHDLG